MTTPQGGPSGPGDRRSFGTAWLDVPRFIASVLPALDLTLGLASEWPPGLEELIARRPVGPSREARPHPRATSPRTRAADAAA